MEERQFGLEEVFAAREAFITGATTLIMPVVRIDGRDIGAGISWTNRIEIARDFS